MVAYRLKEGGRINRDKKVSFRFNRRRLTGFEGDTIASALLANDVRQVGRSFKYHRLRGVMSAGPEEGGARARCFPLRPRTGDELERAQREGASVSRVRGVASVLGSPVFRHHCSTRQCGACSKSSALVLHLLWRRCVHDAHHV